MAPPQVFYFLLKLLRLDFPDGLPADQRENWLRFVMRWQQLTGPITAKGVEDTTFYTYNPLISLNEVGGSPKTTSIEEFHRFNCMRKTRWPASLNATSTHDTKRSEDVRARIHVLSEIPGEWSRLVNRWSRWNRTKKREVNGKLAPDANEELHLYQTLIGAWPLNGEDISERLRPYMIKAVREAKVNTSWMQPDEEHEKALLDFVDAILAPPESNRFLAEFLRLQQRTAFYGAVNALSQVLLKIASPGIPDFYQSTITWDLSLVDPDNRRPVDFARQMALVDQVRNWPDRGRLPLIRELLNHWQDGGIKAYVTHKAMNYRRDHSELFQSGDYIPVFASEERRNHLVAFLRRRGPTWCLAAVPRMLANLSAAERWPLGKRIWKNSHLILPEGAPATWHNVLTGEVLRSAGTELRLDEVFQHIPVVLLDAES